jgi:hypothetical protein
MVILRGALSLQPFAARNNADNVRLATGPRAHSDCFSVDAGL